MKKYRIFPGTIGSLGVVIDLFGFDAIVDPGIWMGPVYVYLSKQDYEASISLLAEVGLKIEAHQ